MIIFVIVYVMGIPKDVSIYAKINSFGVVFIGIIIVFILGLGFYSLSNTDFTTNEATFEKFKEEYAKDQKTPYVSYIDIASENFAPIMGILGGGYYFHNMSLSVVRNSKNPDKNIRDVFVGYVLVFLTYVCSGTLGYYGFTGSIFEEKMAKYDFVMQQNCLNMFEIKSPVGTFLRLCAFLQILFVNALILSVERAQILLLLTGSPDVPSQKVNLVMNFLILLPAFLLGVWYPKVGDLAAKLGAFACMFVVYVIPVVTFI